MCLYHPAFLPENHVIGHNKITSTVQEGKECIFDWRYTQTRTDLWNVVLKAEC